MSDDRQRIDPITAEHLVRDARARAHDADPLARVLAAAAMPARPDELAGEDAAVSAFRAANLARPAGSTQHRRRRTAVARLASAKVAVAIIAVSGGGIAVAAGSGHLPGVSGPNHHSTAGPATSRHTTQQPSGPGSLGNRPSSGGSGHQDGSTGPGRPSSTSTPPSGSPSPNLRGLCTAYTAHAGDNPNKALDNPAFTALIDAAGGKDRVGGYCSALLGGASAEPSKHAGGNKPTHGAPATHRSGTPGPRSARPSSHPSGPPSHPGHPAPPTH